MPAKVPHPCYKPGCPKLTANRFCTEHGDEAKAYDRSRADDPIRLAYKTAAWKRTRITILNRDPLCKIANLCVKRYGRPVASEVVDHVLPVRQGGEMWDVNNLQGACKACHDHKTSQERALYETASTSYGPAPSYATRPKLKTETKNSNSRSLEVSAIRG